MSEEWYSIVEYARTFNVSDMTVRRRIKTGKLRAVLQDGKYYIPVGPQSQKLQKTHPHPQATVRQSAMPLPPIVDGLNRIDKDEFSHASRSDAVQLPKIDRREIFSNVTGSRNIESAPKGAPVGYKSIPSHLVEHVAEQKVFVQGTQLLEYCNEAISKFKDFESKLKERNEADVRIYELQLNSKDQEIRSLRQQLEDLQLLVKIMEKRKTA